MSWYGTHPAITKAAARALLPARACRICVYYTRVRGVAPVACTRCGRGDQSSCRLRIMVPIHGPQPRVRTYAADEVQVEAGEPYDGNGKLRTSWWS